MRQSFVKQQILNFISSHGQITVKEVVELFKIERRMAQYHLKSLIESKQIQKVGKVPRVFYIPIVQNVLINRKKSAEMCDMTSLLGSEGKIIDDNFLLITSIGQKKYGTTGFAQWCEERNFFVDQKAKEYCQIFKKYEQERDHGVFDGIQKLKTTFKDNALDGMWYLDLYAWEIFGKTKLGQLLLYAKQSQNREIIEEILEISNPKIQKFIAWKKIDAVGFVAPSIKRDLQFMHILKKELALDLPMIEIQKAQTEVVRPQKTLSKLRERIQNAEATLFVKSSKKYKTILIIDDAVGSGATLHEIAKKIKRQKMADIVLGLSITGSVKGFDVISEV